MKIFKLYFSFDLEPENIFPFEALQEQLHKYGVFGMSIASTLLPMLTSDEDSCPDLDTLAEQIHDPFAAENTREEFNRRMRDVVVDMNRLDYI